LVFCVPCSLMLEWDQCFLSLANLVRKILSWNL
jgi:hypothetical protein